jgi:hypothetical protein
MTVINMMSFGDSGAAVADEQSLRGMRKNPVAQKLKMINDSVIYGAAGVSQFVKEVYDAIKEYLEKRKKEDEDYKITPEEIYRVAKGMVISLKNDKKDYYLRSNFSISLEELQTGVKERGGKLDEAFKRKASEMVEKYIDEYSSGILMAGISEGRFDIYLVDSNGNSFNKISESYESIGSGRDASDRILSSYVAELPRELRDKIPVEEGLVKLIEATNGSANSNIGVGGSPSIVYLNKDGEVKIPNESQCILASEVVEGLTRGLLNQDFVYGAVRRLVLENADFRTVEEEMRQKAKDWAKLDRVLRGYKE